MSSILKALKKLEEEKTARTPDALKIDTEILRGESPSRFPYRKATLLAVLFFVCGSAVTYLYVKRGAHPAGNRASAPSPQAVHHPPDAEDRAAPDVPAEPLRSPAKSTPPPAPAPTTSHAKPPKHARATAATMTGQPKPGTVAAPAALPAAKRIPSLRVDGIAYHFGSADSLAVVNGTTVYAGATVEGAKIEEIGKDRIRFNYEGERFDIPLGKSN